MNSIKITKVRSHHVEIDGDQYNRLGYENWEKLHGSSWEPCSPDKEEKLEEIFQEHKHNTIDDRNKLRLTRPKKPEWIIYDKNNPSDYVTVIGKSKDVNRKLIALMRIDPKSWKKKKIINLLKNLTTE